MLRHNDVRKEEEVEQIGHSFSLATHFSTLQRRNYVHVTKHDIKNVRQSSVASLHGVLIVDCSVEQSGISLFNTLYVCSILMLCSHQKFGFYACQFKIGFIFYIIKQGYKR